MLLRIVKGFGVAKETLEVDIIDEVGQEGSYITSAHTRKHTLNHYKSELWTPSLARGDVNILDKSRAGITRILNEHEPEPLKRELKRELSKIIEKTEVSRSQ